uniref:TonB-dependent receptor n=1 Tax=Marinimicrobium sp. UBA4209 TaxID=1946810 RepID=UPI00257BA214
MNTYKLTALSLAIAASFSVTAQAQSTPALEEILVTAQKREQTLAQIPQSISVLGGDKLEQQQATSFVDYAAQVPGLSLEQSNPGQTRVILRGVNTGGASPTASIYVDETPFSPSTGQSNGAVLAGDIDTFDIERVEVLRGPQGTLGGRNSSAGLINIYTAPPEFEFSGYGAFTYGNYDAIKIEAGINAP